MIAPALAPSYGRDARSMKLAATGLLVVMAAIYLVARVYEAAHPGVGYVKAFAEAAMVGGMADWFAVTALFRHPMGIPIPHTAIIPRKKDRIGETMAQFLRNNFLTPTVVARRMHRIDVAGAVGRFLAEPDHGGAGRLRDGASKLLANLLESLDEARLGGMVKAALVNRLRALDIAPLLGQALEAAMRENRHTPLINGLIVRMSSLIAANDNIIRGVIHERSNSIMRWTGLDETLANGILSGLDRLFAEVADDPEHPLRAKADAILAELAVDLQHDETMQARVDSIKFELIQNPALQRWIEGLWEQARSALLRAARDPQRTMAGRFGDVLRQLGGTLESDPHLRMTINRFTRRSVVGATARYGDGLVRLISDTVRGWDAQKITTTVEAAVGRDLQYIRINGTMVGGLVGLALHAIDTLA